MITAFLLSIPGYILTAIISLLPEGGTIPAEFTSALTTVWNAVNAFSFIVPVGTLLTVFGLAMAYHFAIFGVHAFNWVLKKIPGMQ